MPAGIWRLARRQIAGLIGGNRLFAAVLVPALLLRVDAELGYRWQSWFNDSFTYVRSAVTLTPETTRPSGYPVYLWLLSPAHSYLLVTASQHLMGLLVAVMIYALARHRFAAPAWLAVLAALPVLYDGFEIQLEHLIMSDTLFLFLAMSAVTVLLWSPRPSWRACLAAGLLVGMSTTVRSTGLPLIVVFVVYLLIRFMAEWRRLLLALAAGLLAFAVPVAGYAGWYEASHGEFAMTDATGVFLYSRVMTFADCSRMSPPPDLVPLCTSVPPGKRPNDQDYIWKPVSPLLRLGQPEFSPTVNKLAERFAVRAIEAQPLDYARAVFDDTVRSFEWNRTVFPDPATYDAYLFGYHSLHIPGSPFDGYSSAVAYYARGNASTVVVDPFAAVIRSYQRHIWLPDSVYGAILLVGLFGIVRRWRAGPGRDAVLPWLCSLAIIVTPAATAEFDYRYVTTAVPFACLAAAVAFGTARLPRRGTGGGADGRLADASDDKRDLTADAP
jgi:4-amino-4-deoxy-L-arabinose transferase-like glycosyltransferase